MYSATATFERVVRVRSKKFPDNNSVEESAGVGRGLLSNMCKRNTMPKADNLAKIADALECSIDYLMGRTEVVTVAGSDDLELGEDEKKLLDWFWLLDGPGRNALLLTAEQLTRGITRGEGSLGDGKQKGNLGNAG